MIKDLKAAYYKMRCLKLMLKADRIQTKAIRKCIKISKLQQKAIDYKNAGIECFNKMLELDPEMKKAKEEFEKEHGRKFGERA